MKDVIISGASPMLMPREDPVGKIVFAVVVLVVGIACFVALMTFLAAVFNGTAGRTRKALERSPLLACLTGAASYLVLGGIAAWFYSRAFIERLLETEIIPGMLLASVLFAAIAVAASFLGAAGLFTHIGNRIAVVNGGQMSGVRRLTVATLVSALAALFPVIGWFVIAPALLSMACGGLVLGVIRGS